MPIKVKSKPDLSPKRIRKFVKPFLVPPGAKVRLPNDFDPASTGGYNREDGAGAQQILQAGITLLADYQARLAAQSTHGVLVILQAMDAAGKDGTIRHVMSGVNPQGVDVSGFKVPSADELAHDYLWRYQAKIPARGRIGIFNRSYYEEVLVVRVHPQLLETQKLPDGAAGQEGARDGIWQRRFREINNYERYLSDNGVRIVKLFLNLSREAQRERFVSRIDQPSKNWKFTASDVRERAFWDAYQAAFSDVLSNTSTKWAPWYVVPADNKWFSRLVAAAAIGNALLDIDPDYPTASSETKASLETARRELEAESRGGKRQGKTKNGKKKAGGR
ncbi:MAG: polyphosphate kinase 2 family protein [Chloroflexi bacterium]|nr:MAG: polyphosphate kinase 2 family protein [Chloroflexota bacterium]